MRYDCFGSELIVWLISYVSKWYKMDKHGRVLWSVRETNVKSERHKKFKNWWKKNALVKEKFEYKHVKNNKYKSVSKKMRLNIYKSMEMAMEIVAIEGGGFQDGKVQPLCDKAFAI